MRAEEGTTPQTAHLESRLALTCGLMVIVLLAATLWPFDPFPRNRVHWLTETNGIAFDGEGLVRSYAPLQFAAGLDQSCTLELLLKPGGDDATYTILSFYAPNQPTQFSVNQWMDGLLVTRENWDTKRTRRIKFDVDHALQVGQLVLLTFVSGPHGTVVYKNGLLAQVFPNFIISQNDLSGQIVLGASAVHYQPWVGEVRGVAVYPSALTPEQVLKHYQSWTTASASPADLDGAIALYPFDERTGSRIRNAVPSGPDLRIADSFAVPYKAWLTPLWKEFEVTRRYAVDVVLNIAGFVPLGFLLGAYLAISRSRTRAIVYTILASGLLSFTIEILQGLIPRRVSGTTDVITNTLGAAVGAILATSRSLQVRRYDSTQPKA